MKSETIKWEKFCGVKLTDEDIMEMLKDLEYEYRHGRRRISRGDILIEVEPYSHELGIEVYRRIKSGIVKK